MFEEKRDTEVGPSDKIIDLGRERECTGIVQAKVFDGKAERDK